MTVKVKESFFDCWHCIVPVGRGNDYDKVKEMVAWCRDIFTKGRWGYEDLHKETSFILYSEEDVALFVLKWS